MFLKVFFILLQGVLYTQASGSYYVSVNQTSWKDANKTHTFATPDIHYNGHNLSINIDIDLDRKDVWIGYFKALTAFDYFGCMQQDQARIITSKSFILKRNGPGLCFSACGKKLLVGLGGEKCYCLEHQPTVNHHLPYCDKDCEAENALLCGGQEHVSLYKVIMPIMINDRLSTIIENGNCLWLSHGPHYHVLQWTSCRLSFNPICTFVNGTIFTTNGNYKWKNAAKKCFQLNGFAMSYANTNFNSDQLRKAEAWTGVIRSSVVYKYNENDTGNLRNIECGYIHDSKDVMFTDECDIQQNFLYQYETSSTIRTSSTTITTASKITTSSGDDTKPEMTYTSGIRSTSLTETVTSPSNISTNTEPIAAEEQEGVSKGSDVGAIAGASVVSVLAVIVAVVVIVILKRRKKLPVICKGTSSQKESGYQQSKRTMDMMSREDNVYDHAGEVDMDSVNTNANNPYAHTYFVIEPHVNESNTDNTTYDTSGNGNKTVTETDNVYNKLELDNNKTYDLAHTNIQNGIRKPDDTYDTTEKAAMKLKARPSKDSDTFGDTGEDEYSHITKKQVNNIKTDNVYGVPNNLENAYGDVGTSNKNNPHDEGDTYSHINNKQ